VPAKISQTSTFPGAFASPIALQRLGRSGSGVLFIDAEGKTFVGTSMNPKRGGNMLKVVLIGNDGKVSRMVEPEISWPLRIAPKDHVVTFQNEE